MRCGVAETGMLAVPSRRDGEAAGRGQCDSPLLFPGLPARRKPGGPAVLAVSAGRVTAGTVVHPPSTVMSTAGTTVAFRGGKGVWGETWNRAVFFRGRGGSGFPPSQFLIVLFPSVCAKWSRRDPDLALLSC